jgi:hypothetical protein
MNAYLSAVNQKLFHVSLLCRQMEQGRDNRHLQRVLAESAVYQLVQAYRHHLREIAANYQCPDPQALSDVDTLTRALMDREKWPAEAQEMKNLEQDDQSWLNQLLRTLDGFDRVDERESAMEQDDRIPLAPVTDSGNELPALDEDQVGRWLESLRELVERHRSVMFEC